MIINNSSDKETGYIPGVCVSKKELLGRLDKAGKGNKRLQKRSHGIAETPKRAYKSVTARQEKNEIII